MSETIEEQDGEQERTLSIEFPKKLNILFKPKRYKILYGGRGGAKSWGIARALLIMGMQRPLRVLCAREFQKSIDDSVHKLLKDQILALELDEFYDIQKAKIVGLNGTEIFFTGLRHNASGLRSYEGIDICWVEEAVNVSKESWETLIPTIRKEGSEIWLSFNPNLGTDYTYKRFVVKPPENSYCIEIGWRDNKWFPKTLDQERRELKRDDPDSYLTVWEGKTRKVLEGAVFANELRKMVQENRITRVPYGKRFPVSTYWDLGRRDMTSIWFAQRVGLAWHFVKFYENCGHSIDHYIKYLKDQEYLLDTIWLPHDGGHETIHHPLSVKAQIKAAFPNLDVRVLPQTSLETQISAARLVMNTAFIDEELCADGIQSLTHYQYEIDEETKERSKKPLHDWASHGSSAFMTFALSCREDRRPPKLESKPKPPIAPPSRSKPNSGAWMRRIKL